MKQIHERRGKDSRVVRGRPPGRPRRIAAIINLQPDMTLVGTAATGGEGLERFFALSPDVALVDLQLPDMSGFDLIRKIREKSPNARIIVLSSHEGDVDIRRALEAERKDMSQRESFARNY